MNSGLNEEIIQELRSIFKKYPQVDSALLYGSRAMGTYKKGSDIDLALTGAKLELTILNKISNDIDDLLMPYKTDLSILSYIENKDLLEHINRVGVEFYKKS